MKTFKGFLSEAAPKLKHKVDPIKKQRERDERQVPASERDIKHKKTRVKKKPASRMTGAELRAKFMKKESVEGLVELSSKTLSNYIKKATKDSEVQSKRSRSRTGSADYNDAKDALRRTMSRYKGVARATNKLVNKHADAGVEKKRVKRPASYDAQKKSDK